MNDVFKLLPEILRLSGNQEDVCEKAVFAAWGPTVGELVAANSAPARLYRKTLIVATIDQTWKRQLERMSGQILFKLNSNLCVPLVTALEFRVDQKFIARMRSKSGETVEFKNLAASAAQLRPQAQKISDENLRESFLRAASKSLCRMEQKQCR